MEDSNIICKLNEFSKWQSAQQTDTKHRSKEYQHDNKEVIFSAGINLIGFLLWFSPTWKVLNSSFFLSICISSNVFCIHLHSLCCSYLHYRFVYLFLIILYLHKRESKIFQRFVPLLFKTLIIHINGHLFHFLKN